MTKEHGYLVEREKVYEGRLDANNAPVKGYRVFSEDGETFQGLLDFQYEHALWYVKEDSLRVLIDAEIEEETEEERA